MKNDKFWNECNDKSIRKKVAEFIDNDTVLSTLTSEKYYHVEDAIIEFIKQLDTDYLKAILNNKLSNKNEDTGYAET